MSITIIEKIGGYKTEVKEITEERERPAALERGEALRDIRGVEGKY